jgi:predicted phosphodiesterase
VFVPGVAVSGERWLVLGDHHGDAEALERVLEDTAGERFEYAVHVGDFTRTMRHDDEALGVEQLRETEPLLERLDGCADHGLLWVWGDQDRYGDLAFDLDVGTEIPGDDRITVGGRQFTNSLSHVDADTVLVTHDEHWRLADHFDGLAHLCGNTHFGRRFGRRLNAAFLQETNPETGEQRYGGYFVVEFEGRGFDVEARAIGDLGGRVCERHRERGVQFLPSDWDCMYAWDDRVLLRELSASAFYGVTDGGERDSADPDELLEHAVGLWDDDPPAGFRQSLQGYLDSLADDRYAPLAERADGRLGVAEDSYSY